MPYAAGRTYFDADSHIMELPGWLEEFADPADRERLRPLALGAAGAMADVAIAAAQQRRGDQAAAEALASLGRPREDFDRETFRTLVGDLVQRSVELGSGLQAGAVVLELTRIAGGCGLRPAPELAMVGKALLNLDERIEAYVVESENFESIHNHSAYALIEKNKRAR